MPITTRARLRRIREAYVQAHPNVSAAMQRRIVSGKHDDVVTEWNVAQQGENDDRYAFIVNERSKYSEQELHHLRDRYIDSDAFPGRMTRRAERAIKAGDYDYDVFRHFAEEPAPAFDFDPYDDDDVHDMNLVVSTHYFNVPENTIVTVNNEPGPYNAARSVWGSESQEARMKRSQKAWNARHTEPESWIVTETMTAMVVRSFTGRPYQHMVILGTCNVRSETFVVKDRTLLLEELGVKETVVPLVKTSRYRLKQYGACTDVNDVTSNSREPVGCSCEDFQYRHAEEALYGCKHMWYIRLELLQRAG